MLNRFLLLSTLLFVLASTTWANPFGDYPFGFKEGMAYEEVKAIKELGITKDYIWNKKRILELSNPPARHPLFINYQLYFTEKTGLYVITAYSDTIRIGKGGSIVMPKFIEVRDEIAGSYGLNFQRVNYVDGGAAWETPIDWLRRVTQSIRRRNTVNSSDAFMTAWKGGLVTLPEGVNYVGLRISLTGDPLYIVATIHFDNRWDVK